jgi:trafficking protein particle complex subunit 2
MSYYFTIITPQDKPIFNLSFGTSKAGGDGQPHFRHAESARYMNEFIAHASLDLVEDVMWTNGGM